MLAGGAKAVPPGHGRKGRQIRAVLQDPGALREFGLNSRDRECGRVTVVCGDVEFELWHDGVHRRLDAHAE